MDKGDGGGDQMEDFHRSEAISAVADVGIFAEEEEDEDYEDLYNDVNVGEGFFQSVRKNEDLAFQNQGNNDSSNIYDDIKVEKKPDLPAVAQNLGATATVPGESSGVVGGGGRVPGHELQGVRSNEIKGPAGGSSGGMRVELNSGLSKVNDYEERTGNSVGAINNSNQVGMQVNAMPMQPQQLQSHGGGIVNVHDEGVVRNVNGVGNMAGNGGGGGGTVLFVGDLHWWTTDAELEAELCKYGAVKEVKFFDEKASGKSKGYCQVEFFDPGAASACKDGMNGYVFNGRPCVVAFASPFTVKKMGEAQVHRNQQVGGQAAGGQARRGVNDGGGKSGGVGGAAAGGGANIATGGNYQGGDGNRGRGNWGRGNGPGMGNRGPLGPMRNRPGGMGGRGMGMMGNAGNGFGQGMGGAPPLMHPNMMGQGFDPAFGGPMGRMAGYGGFPGGPAPPFGGILSSFPPVGMPGVAPHVNPAFFGRGMPMGGMGMMPSGGVDGPNMGMWSDPSMGGWAGEENGGGRAGESSYGEEAASDHQFAEVSHDRGGWQNSMKEKDRAGSSDRRYRDDREPGLDRDVAKEKDVAGPDHEWPERRHRDDRDGRDRERERDRDRERSRDRERERDRDRDRDRDRHREDRDKYADHHRYRDREAEHDDEWDRGRSSRTHSKSRLPQEDDHHSRSRDADYGKRRRLTSE